MNQNDKDTIHKRVDEIGPKIHEEVDRIIRSGAVGESTALSTVLRVALENIAEGYPKDSTDYRNLKRF